MKPQEVPLKILIGKFVLATIFLSVGTTTTWIIFGGLMSGAMIIFLLLSLAPHFFGGERWCPFCRFNRRAGF